MAMVLDAFVSFFVEKLGDRILNKTQMQLGLDEDLQLLTSKLKLVGALLRDADRKIIVDESIQMWLSELREVMYDADDLIDDYMVEAEGQEDDSAPGSSVSRSRILPSSFSRFLPSWFSRSVFRHKLGNRLGDITRKLEQISQGKPASLQPGASIRRDGSQLWGGRLDRETSSLIDEDEVVGIDLEARDLVDRLTRGSSNAKCLIYAIVGMGGIGKTTLAQKVYNDGRIKSDFDVRLWVCVSQDVNTERLLKAVIESAGENSGGIETKALLESKVGKIVENRRFLLVLDDIWDGNIWEDSLKVPLLSCKINSRVLITTRREDVARRMMSFYSHKMKLLPEDQGLRMLCKPFLDGSSQERVQSLRGVGMEIVRKCKGLPLAIKVIRGVLMGKEPSESTWREVLQSQLWDLPEKELPKGVIPALYLSYEELLPHLKLCFAYCSLFPEDFIFYKLNLLQMWAAEGFIKPQGTRAIADVADDCYRELMGRNLLQAVPNYFEDWGCKMHDVVRELALHVSQRQYICRGAQGSDDVAARLRHLVIVGGGLSMVPKVYKRNECLRTVSLSKNTSINSLPNDFFKLGRLRVLDLACTGIGSLQDSIRNLKYLRFLNVSSTKIKELPETIQYLRNLQTLKANDCQCLHKLPNGVTRLLKLTHLTVAGTPLDEMPSGIEELRNLHTLHGFVANEGNQSGNKMKELEMLTQLRRLTMHRLEKVADKAEAETAVLRNKSNLKHLRLSCTLIMNHKQLEDPEIQKIEEVFEGLSPPSSLESLHVEGFFGRQFPSWISNPYFCDLKWLRLENCKLCKQLPHGQFPNLRVLNIWNVASVSTVGPEFFCGGAQEAPAFPLLEELYFRGMSSWRGWSGLERGALPVLKKLHIVNCPRLRSLPGGLRYATSLRLLVIEDAKKLRAIEDLPSVSELKISNNQKLRIVSDLPGMKAMDISNCHRVGETKRNYALRDLRLSADEMHALPIWLAQITSLHRLDLTCSIDLLKRCSKGGEDWNKICLLPSVEARTSDGSNYISYVKSQSWYESNLTEINGDSAGVALPPNST